MTGVLIHLKDKKLLLVACYEARAADTEAGRERDLANILQTLEVTIQKARQKTGTGQLEVLICADLNRYHVLWGGHHPVRARERRGEGDRIVDFIQETGLNSLIPAGTVTWEHQFMDITSTVDLVLGSKAVQEELVHCRIHSPDHGSDHKPIQAGCADCSSEHWAWTRIIPAQMTHTRCLASVLHAGVRYWLPNRTFGISSAVVGQYQ
jgi:hypothetical protein